MDCPPSVPRMCLLEKNAVDHEYGYNLHAEREHGQFVGDVDADSPAERAGLRCGDRILTVNGHPAGDCCHERVVALIREHPLCCQLLVIDEPGLRWFKDKGCQPEQWQGRTVDRSSPLPQLCILRKSTSDDEFGFNLHAEKGHGHFIGKVDFDGVGDKAGLVMGQRIVGVNGQLIYPDSPHKDVVSLIKQHPMQTCLLVVSERTDQLYQEQAKEYSFHSAIDSTPKPLSKVEIGNVRLSSPIPSPETPSIPDISDDVDFNLRNECRETKKEVAAAAGNLFDLSAAEMKAKLQMHKKVDSRIDGHLTIQEKYNVVTNM